MVYLMGLLFLVFCHPARQTPLTNDRLLPAEEFLIYVGNETRAKGFFLLLNHANKVNDLHPAAIKTGRFVYKRARGEQAMSSTVIDVCFVILFLILWRDEGGINLSWMQGGRPAAQYIDS